MSKADNLIYVATAAKALANSASALLSLSLGWIKPKKNGPFNTKTHRLLCIYSPNIIRAKHLGRKISLCYEFRIMIRICADLL